MVRTIMGRSDERALSWPTSVLSSEFRNRDASAPESSSHINLARGRVLSSALPVTFYTQSTEVDLRALAPVSQPADIFAGVVIMERSRDGHTRPAVQIACLAKSCVALLEIIQCLCEKFVAFCGFLPVEVSLHIVVRLQLLLCGYTCIYGGLCCEGGKRRLVKIPFVAHYPIKRKNVIVVRGV
jgi:hypothetical protein